MHEFNLVDTASLKKEVEILRNENIRLKQILSNHNINYVNSTITNRSEQSQDLNQVNTMQKRLNLFKSYFVGRGDVFARYQYNASISKGAYYPVVKGEFKYYKSKERLQLIEKGVELYEPLTDTELINHLTKKDNRNSVVGIYPIVNGKECFFIVIDLDHTNWKSDIVLLSKVCNQYHIPCLLERSQSGDGGHLWLFFENPISASKARELATRVLTSAMQTSNSITMTSYDRLFPSQDYIVGTGLGNLIALPLQNHARIKGNSVFVNEFLEIEVDQWLALLRTKKMSEVDVDASLLLMNDVKNMGGLRNHLSETTIFDKRKLEEKDYNKEVKVIQSNCIYIDRHGLSTRFVNELYKIASFQNPNFKKMQQLRKSTRGESRVITRAEENKDYIILPRGCMDELIKILETSSVNYHLDDKRSLGSLLKVDFNGTLKVEQTNAANIVLNYDTGIIQAATAFGKTVLASYIISKRKVNTLILVHTKKLLAQWKKELQRFLQVDGQQVEIGTLGGGKDDLTGVVDVVLYKSLINGKIQEIKEYGMVVVDECHNAASIEYENILRQLKSKYVHGLTATIKRSDDMQELLLMQCGSIIYNYELKEQLEKRTFACEVIPKYTNFRTKFNSFEMSKIYDELSRDEYRNKSIVEDLVHFSSLNNSILLLANRIEQLELISKGLEEHNIDHILLHGQLRTKQKNKAYNEIESARLNDAHVLVLSTGMMLGEGFNFPNLDTLFMASPIAWEGNVIQYVGRISREHNGKENVKVIDYFDFHVPVLVNMYKKRCRSYKKAGFALYKNSVNPIQEQLFYSHSEFLTQLSKDIEKITNEIIFVIDNFSPRKLKSQLLVIESVLDKKQCKIVFLTNKMKNKLADIDSIIMSNDLQNVCFIKTNDNIVPCILIDKNIIWFGDVQCFGNLSKDILAYRFEDSFYYQDFYNPLKAIVEIVE